MGDGPRVRPPFLFSPEFCPLAAFSPAAARRSRREVRPGSDDHDQLDHDDIAPKADDNDDASIGGLR